MDRPRRWAPAASRPDKCEVFDIDTPRIGLYIPTAAGGLEDDSFGEVWCPVNAVPGCVFCEIVAGQSPASVRYVDEEIIAIVNKLTWAPVMLLVMPKQHLSQMEMWGSGLMPRLGEVAVQLGCQYAPNGFRLLSNFGHDAMQSQSHGHLHVIGGTYLGPYA